MSKGVSLVVGLLVVAAAGTSRAESIDARLAQSMETYRYTGVDVVPARAEQPPDLDVGPRVGQIYEFDTKSPRQAFLYSLVVPGLGQLYAGSKIKAALFFVADVALWGGYFSYRSSGHTKEDEFRAYADAHWSDGPYWDSMLAVRNILKWHDADYFPHHLPYEITPAGDTVANKNLEYYENVGKYDQFVWGWDDLAQISSSAPEPEDNYQSQHRLVYVVMREDANKQFDRARAMAFVSIANHLISAFDAALSARRHNRMTEQAQKIDFDVKLATYNHNAMPWVNVAYRF
jgi:hypothetical protein